MKYAVVENFHVKWYMKTCYMNCYMKTDCDKLKT